MATDYSEIRAFPELDTEQSAALIDELFSTYVDGGGSFSDYPYRTTDDYGFTNTADFLDKATSYQAMLSHQEHDGWHYVLDCEEDSPAQLSSSADYFNVVRYRLLADGEFQYHRLIVKNEPDGQLRPTRSLVKILRDIRRYDDPSRTEIAIALIEAIKKLHQEGKTLVKDGQGKSIINPANIMLTKSTDTPPKFEIEFLHSIELPTDSREAINEKCQDLLRIGSYLTPSSPRVSTTSSPHLLPTRYRNTLSVFLQTKKSAMQRARPVTSITNIQALLVVTRFFGRDKRQWHGIINTYPALAKFIYERYEKYQRDELSSDDVRREIEDKLSDLNNLMFIEETSSRLAQRNPIKISPLANAIAFMWQGNHLKDGSLAKAVDEFVSEYKFEGDDASKPYHQRAAFLEFCYRNHQDFPAEKFFPTLCGPEDYVSAAFYELEQRQKSEEEFIFDRHGFLRLIEVGCCDSKHSLIEAAKDRQLLSLIDKFSYWAASSDGSPSSGIKHGLAEEKVADFSSFKVCVAEYLAAKEPGYRMIENLISEYVGAKDISGNFVPSYKRMRSDDLRAVLPRIIAEADPIPADSSAAVEEGDSSPIAVAEGAEEVDITTHSAHSAGPMADSSTTTPADGSAAAEAGVAVVDEAETISDGRGVVTSSYGLFTRTMPPQKPVEGAATGPGHREGNASPAAPDHIPADSSYPTPTIAPDGSKKAATTEPSGLESRAAAPLRPPEGDKRGPVTGEIADIPTVAKLDNIEGIISGIVGPESQYLSQFREMERPYQQALVKVYNSINWKRTGINHAETVKVIFSIFTKLEVLHKKAKDWWTAADKQALLNEFVGAFLNGNGSTKVFTGKDEDQVVETLKARVWLKNQEKNPGQSWVLTKDLVTDIMNLPAKEHSFLKQFIEKLPTPLKTAAAIIDIEDKHIPPSGPGSIQ